MRARIQFSRLDTPPATRATNGRMYWRIYKGSPSTAKNGQRRAALELQARAEKSSRKVRMSNVPIVIFTVYLILQSTRRPPYSFSGFILKGERGRLKSDWRTEYRARGVSQICRLIRLSPCSAVCRVRPVSTDPIALRRAGRV